MEEQLRLPVVKVVADSLPAAWEEAVVRTWEEGAAIATQYDQPGDPPSRDVTAVIVVRKPLDLNLAVKICVVQEMHGS